MLNAARKHDSHGEFKLGLSGHTMSGGSGARGAGPLFGD
jgi:hypothetical protein